MPIEEPDLAALDPADFMAEWKWDGIRVQASAGHDEHGQPVARLYSRTGEDISKSFPDLVDALRLPAAIDGELLILRETRVQSFNVLQQRLNRKAVTPQALGGISRASARLRSAWPKARKICAPCPSPSAGGGWRNSSPSSTIRASIFRRWCRSRPGTR